MSKSTFDPGPPEQRLTITVAGDGTFSADGIDGGGKPIRWSHKFGNGKEVPVAGMPGVTDVTVIHGRVMDEAFSRDGKVIVKIHSVLSDDGNTVTSTGTRIDSRGREVHMVEVLEKR